MINYQIKNYKFIKKLVPKFIYPFGSFIFQILRYYNFIYLDYKLNPLLDFGNKKSNRYFKKEIQKSKFLLEYGSGNTTLYLKKKRIKFISIEGDRNFYNYLIKKKLKKYVLFFDLGFVNYGSSPYLIKYKKNKIMNYAQNILKGFNKKNFPDLFLVDGRFRVLCVIYIYKYIKALKITKFKIILDDYITRKKQYNFVKKIFYCKTVGRFLVLYKIKNNQIDINLQIKKYSNIKD